MEGRSIQLDLPAWDEQSLSNRLRELCNSRIDVRLTGNGSTMMSFKPGTLRQPAQLRVHRMFAGAPPEVVEALAHWTLDRRRRKVCQLLDGFIAANRHLVQRRPVPIERLETAGEFHDLQAYFDAVNAAEFAGEIDAPITWGRFPALRRRRSIRLGSYTPGDHLIRIHPHLDQHFVPDFFVRYIVFHEMLHAQLGIELAPSGRRCIHTREFNRRERRYAEYALAIAWHDNPANLRRLLRPATRSA
jgi:hypothetical protein